VTARHRTGEDGFTLVEIIVALVIVAILMAIAVPLLTGSKRSAYSRDALAAAESYAQAIDQYVADHGGQLPAMPSGAQTGTGAWPSAAGATGPLDLSNQPYMRAGVPDGLKSGHGSLTFVPTSTPAAGGGSKFGYRIVVTTNVQPPISCEIGPSANPANACK
jgi:prepilin-type N-terminal cleavage/methylation domain-containing protein